MRIRLTRAVLAAAALLALHASAGMAQTAHEPPRIAAGTRVRASMPTRVGNRDVAGTDAWQTGTILAGDETSITLRLDRDGTEFRMPLSEIRALQVSQGTVARG